jgi:tetratricopeptide (TPR) repeat protein
VVKIQIMETVVMARPARKAAGAILFVVPLLLAFGCARRSPGDYLKAGDQAMHDNQLGNAQEDYETAVKLAPNDPKTHLKLGDLDLFEHNYPAAEVEYTKAVGLDPDDPENHLTLAKLYSARSQWGSVENQLRAAVALDPSSAEYRRELAQVLNRRNQVGQAEIELRTAAGLAPGDAKLHLALANFLVTIPNERPSADEEYARVRELDPTLVPESATPPAESSAAPPALASTAPPPAAPAAMTAPKPLKPLHRRFLLTHNSPVYQNANSSSGVLAQVHRRKWVRVTGITGDWLQVTLRDGTVGFIPTSAAE